MASAFLRLEGKTVKNKIWDFLIVHSEFDYSMKDIAKFSKVSYASMKNIWKEFIDRKLVIHTRDVGRAKMYKLNKKNPQVKKFIEYFWIVVETEVRKELRMEKENIPSTRAVSAQALPVSAKSL